MSQQNAKAIGWVESNFSSVDPVHSRASTARGVCLPMCVIFGNPGCQNGQRAGSHRPHANKHSGTKWKFQKNAEWLQHSCQRSQYFKSAYFRYQSHSEIAHSTYITYCSFKCSLLSFAVSPRTFIWVDIEDGGSTSGNSTCTSVTLQNKSTNFWNKTHPWTRNSHIQADWNPCQYK